MSVLRLLTPLPATCLRILAHTPQPVAGVAKLFPLVVTALHLLPCILVPKRVPPPNAVKRLPSAQIHATTPKQTARSPLITSPSAFKPKSRCLQSSSVCLYQPLHPTAKYFQHSEVSRAILLPVFHLNLSISTYFVAAVGTSWILKRIKRNYRRNKAHRRMVNSSAVTEFSVVTFNIRAIMDRWHERAPFLKQCIKQLDADVIAFQEVLTGEFAQDQALVGREYNVFECRAALENLKQQGGAAWLLAKMMQLFLDFRPTRALMVRVPPLLEGWRERKGIGNSLMRNIRDLTIAPFYGNSIASRLAPANSRSHPEVLILGSFRAAQRVSLQLPTSFAEEAPLRIWLVNTHLDHADPATRAEQVKAICKWMEGAMLEGFVGVVLTGDLNAPPDEQLHKVLYENGYISAHFTANGREPEVTWPSGLVAPLMDTGAPHCADYVYVRQAPGYICEVASAQVAGNQPHPEDSTLYPSDHVALRVRLRAGVQHTAAAVVTT